MQLKALLSCFGRSAAGEDRLAVPSRPGEDNLPQRCSRPEFSKTLPSSPSAARVPHDVVLDEGHGSRSQLEQSTAGESYAVGTFASLGTHAALGAVKNELEHRRDAMICSRMPAAVTVFSRMGMFVLHQNSASVCYMGDRVNNTSQSVDVLALIFQFEPEKLDRMLRDIDSNGGRWRGIVRVPPSLVVAALRSPTSSTGPNSLAFPVPDATTEPMPRTRSEKATTLLLIDTTGGSLRTAPDGPTGHPDGTDEGRAEATAAAAAATPPPQPLPASAVVPELATRHGDAHPDLAAPAAGMEKAAHGMERTWHKLAGAAGTPAPAAFTASPTGAAAPPPGVVAAEEMSAAAGKWSSASVSGQAPLGGALSTAPVAHGCTAPMARGFLSPGSHTQASGTATLSLGSSRPRSVSHSHTTPFSGITQLTSNGQPQTSDGHFVEFSVTNVCGAADLHDGSAVPGPVLIKQPVVARRRTLPCSVGFELGDTSETAFAAAAAEAAGLAVDPPAIGRSLVWDASADPLATSTFSLALGRPVDTASVATKVLDGAAAASAAPAAGVGVGGSSRGTSAGEATGGSGAALAGVGDVLERRDSSGVRASGGGNVRVVDMASASRRKSVSQRNLSVGQPIPRASSFLSPRHCASPAAAAAVTLGGGGYLNPPRPPSSIGSLPGSPHSRALAFASSLRNAPMGTQALAEGRRRGSLHVPRPHSRGWLGVELPGGAAPGSAVAAAPVLRATSGRLRAGHPALARDYFLRSRRSVDFGQALRIARSSRNAASANSFAELSPSQTDTMPGVGGPPAAAAASLVASCPPQSGSVAAVAAVAAASPRASIAASAVGASAPAQRGASGGGGGGGVTGVRASRSLQSHRSGRLRCPGVTIDDHASTPAAQAASPFGTADGGAGAGVHAREGHTGRGPGDVGSGGGANTDATGGASASTAAASGRSGAGGLVTQQEKDLHSLARHDPRVGAVSVYGCSGGGEGSGGATSQTVRSLRAAASGNGRVHSWANVILTRVGSFRRSSSRPRISAAAAAVGADSFVGELLGLSTGSLGPAHGSQPQPQPHTQQGLREPPPPPQQQQQSECSAPGATPAALAAASPAQPPPDDCWHEIWATKAVDPITGQEVVVLSQHDVSAKVIAERHLALVMEAEHRLLEQLFPKHILTHVTEEWIAEAERAEAAGGAAAAAGTRAAPSGVTMRSRGPANGGGSEWRPVVRDSNALATWHPEVTLLFADIKGFTPMCKVVTPREVMTMLNSLFSRFDALLDKFGVFKVETIGDCYFVAGGLICEDEDGVAAVRDGESRGDPLHAQKVFMFAKAMLAAAREVRMPSSGEPVQIRIGISSGPVVSGVVGTRMPRFCLFGDTVNTTSRMESTGQPGAIHASESAFALLRSEAWEPTGGIEVKGKGLMQTYLWRPILEARGTAMRQLPASAAAAAAALRLRLGGASLARSATAGSSLPHSGIGSDADNAQGATAERNALASAAAAAVAATATVASGAATTTTGHHHGTGAGALHTATRTSGKPTEASTVVDDDSDPLITMLLNHAD